MTTNEGEQHRQCMQRFIDLANVMKGEGVPTQLVSAALMSASAIYTTYTVTGNTNGACLNPSGVDKVTEAYRHSLQQIQDARRTEIEQQQQQ